MARRFILWDHDGVLVDTERWYFASTREALRDLGVELSQGTYLEYMARGRTCWDLARAHGVSDEQIARCRGVRDSIYQEHLRTEAIEVEGVLDVLTTLESSFRMAVVTTARPVDLQVIHESRRILDFFEFVLTIEDYRRPKPAPDPYLAALKRFGARAHEAVAIEDSARGLRSAEQAGLDCLVVRTPFTASQDFAGAWRVVDSIRQVPEILSG